MIEDWVLLTSALTGALTFAGAARQAARYFRARRRREDLVRRLRRVLRIERRLSALAADLDTLLAQGVTWAGISLWPVELRGHLTYLEGLIDEAERGEAELRAIVADGPDERLRSDIERLFVIYRTVATLYRDGTLASYQETTGEPIAVSAAGREPTPTLPFDSIEGAHRLREEFTTLVRTCLYRLGGEDEAESFRNYWPLQRWEVEPAQALNEWATESPPRGRPN